MNRSVLLALACLCVAIAVLAVRPVRTPGPFARDFEAYWSAGVTQNAGLDPYGREIWKAERGIAGVDARRPEPLPFVGPPHTLAAWSLAARVPYQTAAYVWWSALVLSLLALTAAVIRCSGVPFEPPTLLGGIVLAIAFAPLSSDLALGQLALPAFLGAVLVVALADRSLPAAALAASLAFAQPNAALALVSQLGRNRATAAISAGAVFAYLLGARMRGWDWPLWYVRHAAAHAAAERFTAIQFGPAAIAYDFGASPAAATAIAVVAALLAAAAAVAIAVAVADRFARFAGFAALTPFVAGFFHEHDLLVAFAPALWCALRTKGTTRALALAGTLLAGVDWLGLAQRPSGIVQSALLGAAASLAFIALGEDAEFRIAVPVAGAAAALMGCAALVAVRHPVPVWPDALPAIALPATAPIAAVWFDEQRASGLLAAVPAWGLLRSFSLLGSALLAYAIYRRPSCCRTA